VRRGTLILILLLAVAGTACGKKGPPRPPLPPYPADVQTPQARQAGETLEVLVGVPGRRVNGEPIEHLAGVRIFRQAVPAPEGATLPAPSILPGDELQLAGVLSAQDLEGLTPGGRWVFREPLTEALAGGDPLVPHRVAYSVRYLLEGKRWSPHSLPAVMFTGPPVVAPAELTATPVNEGILLRWPPAGPGLASAVFRRDPEGLFPYAPLSVVPEGGEEWLDPIVVLGRTYHYEIRFLAGEDTRPRLSAPAGPVQVTMEDRFPPQPPRDLQALERPGGVDLFWRAGQEIDLGGYRVWRRQLPDGQWQVLTPDAILVTSYSDEAVVEGVEYEYAVSATDTNAPANESERGSPLAARSHAPPPLPVEEQP
jgi:predicted small lipoprotein YifL